MCAERFESVKRRVANNYSTIKSVAAVWLVVSLSVCSLAQAKRTTAQSSGPNRAEEPYQPNYASGPFDNHISRLPAVYEGYDIAETYRRIATVDAKKSEFETTDEYRARVKSALGDHLYAFEPLGSLFSYDADRQEFVVRIPSVDMSTAGVCFGKVWSTDCVGRRGVQLTFAIEESTYYGKAAKSRITKRVTKTVGADYGVVVDVERGDLSRNLSLAVPMKSDIARTSKSRLSVLLICRLRYAIPDQRLLVEDEQRIKWPSVSDPRDIVRIKRYVNMDLQEIWVYDSLSGEIVRKETWERPPFKLSAIFENKIAIISFRRSVRQIEARVGDVIDAEWRIDSVLADHLQVTNLRSRLQHTISK